MIRDRIETLVRSWTSDNGDPPDSDYQRGYMAACEEHARGLIQILAEDAGGWRSMDTLPRDNTVILLTEGGPKNGTYGEGGHRSSYPYYIDDEGTICNTDTWKREPGFPDFWRAVAWQPLPEPPPPGARP